MLAMHSECDIKRQTIDLGGYLWNRKIVTYEFGEVMG
jgi:hypothetical protein